MTTYYYVMAQLPALQPGVQPPLTYDQFLKQMEGCVSKKVYAELKSLKLEPPVDGRDTGCKFLNKWFDYERSLRFALAKVRAEKLQWSLSREEMDRFQISESLDVKRVAREAMAIDDPLKAEQFLTRARVSAIQAMSPNTGFNRDALFAYAVSLLLQTRSQQFSVEEGRSEYKAIYDKILEK